MSWDPYLDLDSGVLRNRLGLTDAAELACAEADFTWSRLGDLERTDLPGHDDLAHLQAFHRYVFGDVYEWAGELRTVAIGKGVPFCPPQDLRTRGDLLFAQLARDDHLRGLDRATFVDALARLLAEINALHPFREGNGRTQRAFLGQLARAAGYRLRWAGMDPRRTSRRRARPTSTATAPACACCSTASSPPPDHPPILRKSQLVIFSGVSRSQACRPSWYIVPPK